MHSTKTIVLNQMILLLIIILPDFVSNIQSLTFVLTLKKKMYQIQFIFSSFF